VTHDQVEAMTLADRIVIMRDGHIEQVGTPDEVFKRPATQFVAGFIGSPPMNMAEATVQGSELVFASGDRLPVPAQFKAKVTDGAKVTFGLRPDDLFPTGHGLSSGGAGTSHEQDLRVSITEPLGNETLVFVEFAGKEWVARMLNPRPLNSGEAISMHFDLSQAHLFDAASGKSLAV
jgi:multiple sugar transport system ATP-binding protein